MGNGPLLPGPTFTTRLQDFGYLLKAWGFGIAAIFALFCVGTLIYGIYWWVTSPDFRQAVLTTSEDTGSRLPPDVARAQAAQRKHKIETATPTQLREMIIEEAPNLVQASNRIPVGHEDELEELRNLASVIPNKKSD
jgi:hypothetical protein